MIPLGKLTDVQVQVLKHLTMRRHAMTSTSLRQELGKRFLTFRTIKPLLDRDYIRQTDQGWLVTDAGVIRAGER